MARNLLLNWASSNTAVAAVDGNGKVTPVGTGSAEITLTSDNGTKVPVR